MNGDVPDSVTAAFDGRDAFTVSGDPSAATYAVTTTEFDATVTVTPSETSRPRYTVRIGFPMLSTATADTVGEAVETGWFDTLDRRLVDAPMATRTSVTLDDYALERDDGSATVRFEYTHEDPERAAAIAKTFVDYVEGTYVEGVVPGYEYVDPVASLLARAAQGEDDGRRGPTPL